MKNNTIEMLLFAYFSGQTTEQEEKELLEWLEADEANKKIMAEMTDWWAMSHVPLFMSDRKADFKEHFSHLINTSQAPAKPKVYHFALLGRIAAAVLLLLMVGVSFYYIGKNTQTINQEIAYYETVVPLGSQTKVVLPDKSVVWINAGSTLRYSDNLSTNRREVMLEGEAYFEVTRDSLKPFIVKSGNLDVKVIGTSFNVKAYNDEETIDVVLLTGKIEVYKEQKGSENNNMELMPNQMLTYNKETEDMYVSLVNGSEYNTWKDGRLTFAQQPFLRIAKDIERKYNIRIDINSNFLKNEVFSGSFTNEQTLDDILREIDVDKKYQWTQTGSTYVIQDK